MIPTVIDTSKEVQEFEITEDVLMPTLTYRLDVEKNRVKNWVDGQEAIKQSIFKILQTERYQYKNIYSDDYGVEFITLFGMPKEYVIAELERRISEALLWDERITAVKNFEFETNKSSISVKFQCDTIFGKVKINDLEVIYG